MKKLFTILSLTLIAGLGACAHSEKQSEGTTANDEAKKPDSPKESKSAAAVRKRAAFDLGCESNQIQLSEIETENFVRPATYGATCGEKKASYIYRMGTIIKN